MLFDCHLDIQSDEFTHVAMGEWVLCSENWTDFKYTLEVTHNTHLLIELGRLCETGFSVEIVETEDIWSSFWSTSDQLWSVDFYKIIIETVFSEELADSWGQFKDGLLSSGSEIDYSIVETSFHFNDRGNIRLLYFLFNLFYFFFFFLLLFLRLLLSFSFNSNSSILSSSFCDNFSSSCRCLLDFWLRLLFHFCLNFSLNFYFLFFLNFVLLVRIKLVVLYFSAGISNL